MTRALSVKLDDVMIQRIKGLAEARDRSAHWLMHKAISEYVEREERREALNQATLAAWQEYEETGLHLTGEEMDAWLAKLEADEDAELPARHR